MKEEILSAFQEVVIDLNANLSFFTEQQLNQVPFPQSWTAGQVGDHLLKSYGAWNVIRGLTSPANRPIDQNCQALSELFMNFELKMQVEPSDFNYPTGNFIMKDLLIQDIKIITNEIIEFANHSDLSLLCMDLELPTFGYLTRLEWLHFYTVHTKRHIYQLKKIFHHFR